MFQYNALYAIDDRLSIEGVLATLTKKDSHYCFYKNAVVRLTSVSAIVDSASVI